MHQIHMIHGLGSIPTSLQRIPRRYAASLLHSHRPLDRDSKEEVSPGNVKCLIKCILYLYEKLGEGEVWMSYITALREHNRSLRALQELQMCSCVYDSSNRRDSEPWELERSPLSPCSFPFALICLCFLLDGCFLGAFQAFSRCRYHTPQLEPIPLHILHHTLNA